MTRELISYFFIHSSVSIHQRVLYVSWLLGGNQREMDRAKAQKKAAAAQKKPKESATSLQKRKDLYVIAVTS